MLDGAALLAGPGHRRLPARRRALPLRAARAPTARTSPRPTSSSKVRRFEDDDYPDRVLLAEANQWPADVVDYFGDRGRRRGGDECHMGFHFPVMPRIFMAVRRESRYPISEILAADPGDPRQLPVGHLPAQPRRADPGDGHRRGARLHVRRVRQGPADEGQHRHPPAAGARCWTTTATRSSCSPRCCCRCPARRSCTTATRSAWATTSGSATATACAPRCSGRPTATPASPVATPGGSTCRRSWTRSTATRRSTSRPSWSSSSSLLHWTRRMIEIRTQNPAFGLGSFTDLAGSNPSVLSFAREHEDDSSSASTTSPASRSRSSSTCGGGRGAYPVELLGGVPFPTIGELAVPADPRGPRLLLVPPDPKG